MAFSENFAVKAKERLAVALNLCEFIAMVSRRNVKSLVLQPEGPRICAMLHAPVKQSMHVSDEENV